MTTSPDLGVPYVPSPPPAQAEVLHNEALNMLIALQKGAIDRGLDTPPGSPTDGDVYIVGTAPTGAWLGKANKIAIWATNAWVFVPGNDSAGTNIAIGARHEGLKLWINDEDALYVWTGSAWAAVKPAYAAADISNTPAGNIAATDVQAAINELDTEKLAVANNLSDVANAGTARTNLGLVAGGAGDIWVEKAGDIMTGGLTGAQFKVYDTVAPVGGFSGPFDFFGTGSIAATFGRGQDTTGGQNIVYQRCRGSAASPTALQSGDNVGNFLFFPYDGTSFIQRALFGASVEGVVSTGVAPTAVIISTGSSAAPSERMRINSSGDLQMGGTNTVIDANRLHRLRQYTVATLPTVGTAGRLAAVTDANAPTYNATVAGGGAVNVPVYDNGSNWTCH